MNDAIRADLEDGVAQIEAEETKQGKLNVSSSVYCKDLAQPGTEGHRTADAI